MMTSWFMGYAQPLKQAGWETNIFTSHIFRVPQLPDEWCLIPVSNQMGGICPYSVPSNSLVGSLGIPQ